jgi:hypothetical protein
MLGWNGKVVQKKAKTYPVLLYRIERAAADQRSFHVARRELERKLKIVILVEKDRVELKSSANESQRGDLHPASGFAKIRAELKQRWPFKDCSM